MQVSTEIVKRIHHNLKVFGYTTLTLDNVQQAVDSIVPGTKPKGNIIAMFAYDMLEEAGMMKDGE